MKTSREIVEKFGPYGDGPIAGDIRRSIQMLVENYARLVAQEALNRAASELSMFQSMESIQEDIKTTEIILP